MGVDTETVTDRGSSNVVLAVTLFLILAGCALSVITWWFWRNTHPDPEALAPLDVMSARSFREQGPIEQRRLLDSARPTATIAAEMDPPLEVESEPVDEEPWFEDDFVTEAFDDEVVSDDIFVSEEDEVDQPGTMRPVGPIDPLLGR